jgi:hypothetical protein
MHVADAPSIGTVVGAGVLLSIAGLLWLAHRLEKEGILKNYSRGLLEWKRCCALLDNTCNGQRKNAKNNSMNRENRPTRMRKP